MGKDIKNKLQSATSPRVGKRVNAATIANKGSGSNDPRSMLIVLPERREKPTSTQHTSNETAPTNDRIGGEAVDPLPTSQENEQKAIERSNDKGTCLELVHENNDDNKENTKA